MRLLLLSLAGAAGALSRYGLGAALGTGPGTTLGINVVGSFLLGLLLAAAPVSREMQIVLGTGLLGAFTTFSTFTVETTGLLRDGRLLAAGGYVIGSVTLGLVAAAAGQSVGSRA